MDALDGHFLLGLRKQAAHGVAFVLQVCVELRDVWLNVFHVTRFLTVFFFFFFFLFSKENQKAKTKNEIIRYSTEWLHSSHDGPRAARYDV